MTGHDDTWAAPQIPLTPVRPDHYQFATSIEGRRPYFKIHQTLGHARNAISAKAHQRSRGLLVEATCVLYQRNELNQTWDPIQRFMGGAVLSHLPWQQEPGDRQKAERVRALADALERFEWSLGRIGFDEATRLLLQCEFDRFRDLAISLGRGPEQDS